MEIGRIILDTNRKSIEGLKMININGNRNMDGIIALIDRIQVNIDRSSIDIAEMKGKYW